MHLIFQLKMQLMGSNIQPNQEPNLTGNISLMLDSRRLVVLVLNLLLCNKKSLEMMHVPKVGIRNKKLELINWVINWNSLIHINVWKM